MKVHQVFSLSLSQLCCHCFFLLQRKRLNLPQLQEKARLQIDIQAAKTVLITVGVFLLCNVPPPLIVALAGQFFKDTEWPRFLAMFSISISSAINPVLYCFRNRRFRSALKQFLKDPCGKSPFKETKKVQNEAVKQPLISLNKQDWIVKGYKIVEIKTTKMEIN